MLIPFFGIVLFGIFYILSALYYPGGSWHQPEQPGFSILHNYLCDLLDEYAINGELNTGSFFARISLGVLCISLMHLWMMLPALFKGRRINKVLMVVSGISALGVTLFLTSGTHDLIVRIAGVLGTIALVSCYIELWRSGYILLFLYGLFCLLVFGMNYYIYETGIYRTQLPMIQKITFIIILGWMMLLNKKLYQKVREYKRNTMS
ncbi:hypothetical protein PP178_11090 [Zeaxanthinibacter sp. PT1]|uniref:hypothetical protein n=1 Tax=Zeaxanthinibacter TaxID=561554 RepID=UPI00234A4756|nr:hypothetical protein [Zeaxanthinibacter sp. PT1]MDC6352099.1 hypothetical protein [Zeaxanthinibacter sp. PT1]